MKILFETIKCKNFILTFEEVQFKKQSLSIEKTFCMNEANVKDFFFFDRKKSRERDERFQ
jgi:hypothetical protein